MLLSHRSTSQVINNSIWNGWNKEHPNELRRRHINSHSMQNLNHCEMFHQFQIQKIKSKTSHGKIAVWLCNSIKWMGFIIVSRKKYIINWLPFKLNNICFSRVYMIILGLSHFRLIIPFLHIQMKIIIMIIIIMKKQ